MEEELVVVKAKHPELDTFRYWTVVSKMVALGLVGVEMKDIKYLKTPIIFLDIDGVFNSQEFYTKRYNQSQKLYKKILRKLVKKKQITREQYYKDQLDSDKIEIFNQLCIDTNAVVVVSSTWRKNKTIEELQKILNDSGATFKIIDFTPYTGYERGTEISAWIKTNVNIENFGIPYYNFTDYVIIDDDSDMLLNQASHFFNTDNYTGMTPTTAYKIKRFFDNKCKTILTKSV